MSDCNEKNRSSSDSGHCVSANVLQCCWVGEPAGIIWGGNLADGDLRSRRIMGRTGLMAIIIVNRLISEASAL